MLRRIARRLPFALAGFLTVLVALALANANANAPPQQVVQLVTQGNLQSRHAIGCIALADGDSTLTPADILPGVAACAKVGDFQKAVALFALATVYGQFDGYRVADRTAGDAAQVLVMKTFDSLPPATRAKLISEAKNQLTDPSRLASICKGVRVLGKPDYLPVYMIQHGMDAFTGIEGDGLIHGFDAPAIWQTMLSDYLHCPAVSTG